MKQVLLVEDDRALRLSLAQSLELENISVTRASSVIEAKDHVSPDYAGVILSDIRMPGRDGFDLLAYVRATDSDLPVVLLTGESDVPTAVRAINDGAYDYLEKPCDPDHLVDVLTRALDHRALVLKSRALDLQLQHSDPAAINFPGTSPVSSRLRDDLRRAAKLPIHVHLFGPTGAGKKLAAHTIHSLSTDREAFVPVSLLNAPDSIFQSLSLPTTPVDISIKHLESATPYQQSNILELTERPNTRILSSSGHSLDTLRDRGLQEELYFALNILQIPLPSLDDRRSDLPQIFEAVLRQAVRTLDMDFPQIPESLMAEISTRQWSDNLPELRNFARSFALNLGQPAAPKPDKTLAEQIDAFERMILSETLRRKNGRASDAATSLGLPRKTFYDKLARHELRPKDFKP